MYEGSEERSIIEKKNSLDVIYEHQHNLSCTFAKGANLFKSYSNKITSKSYFIFVRNK